jgi:hypothetical protein
MEEKIESNRTFQLLDGDKDVLLIDSEAFIVSRFKELIERELIEKFNQLIMYGNNFFNSLRTVKPGTREIGLCNVIKWNFNLEGMSAELLRIGAKEWQKGKIIIKSYIEIENKVIKAQVDVEFSPDEPPKPESPLDDLRELPEYKQQI